MQDEISVNRIADILSAINKNAFHRCPVCFNPSTRFERFAFIVDKVIRAIDLELIS